jgi:hypothetical protein
VLKEAVDRIIRKEDVTECCADIRGEMGESAPLDAGWRFFVSKAGDEGQEGVTTEG